MCVGFIGDCGFIGRGYKHNSEGVLYRFFLPLVQLHLNFFSGGRAQSKLGLAHTCH